MKTEKIEGIMQDVAFYPTRGTGCAEIKSRDEKVRFFPFAEAVLLGPGMLKLVEDESRTGKGSYIVVKISDKLLAKGSLVDPEA